MRNDFDYGELVFIRKDGKEISIGQIHDKTRCEFAEEKISEVMDLVDNEYGRFEVYYFDVDEDDEDIDESRRYHGRMLKENRTQMGESEEKYYDVKNVHLEVFDVGDNDWDTDPQYNDMSFSGYYKDEDELIERIGDSFGIMNLQEFPHERNDGEHKEIIVSLMADNIDKDDATFGLSNANLDSVHGDYEVIFTITYDGGAMNEDESRKPRSHILKEDVSNRGSKIYKELGKYLPEYTERLDESDMSGNYPSFKDQNKAGRINADYAYKVVYAFKHFGNSGDVRDMIYAGELPIDNQEAIEPLGLLDSEEWETVNENGGEGLLDLMKAKVRENNARVREAKRKKAEEA